MRLFLLGTGTPILDPQRPATTAILIEIGSEKVLFDTGRGATMQMLKQAIDPTSIDNIFITHHHYDHICDLGHVAGGAALATIAVGGAILMLGLTQPWGETFPRRIPYWRGKPVPIAMAVIPATLISILIISARLMFIRLAPTGTFAKFFGSGNPATYVPKLFWPLWGLALAPATLAYYYRRRGKCRYCGRL